MAENIQWFANPPQGQVPIAFLPVRIETRFGSAADGSPELWVRVFPDDVHVDSFEPALTAAESVARTRISREPDAGGLGRAGRTVRRTTRGVDCVGRRGIQRQ